MITQKDIEGLFQAVNDMAELRSENKAIKKENEFYKELLTKQLNLPVVSQQRELLLAFLDHIDCYSDTQIKAGYDHLIDGFLKANNCG